MNANDELKVKRKEKKEEKKYGRTIDAVCFFLEFNKFFLF